MNQAYLRFYGELNDLLPPTRRQVTFSLSFELSPSVKDLVESVGVPHTEVDLVLLNGRPAAWSDRVGDGDRISVYPVFESFDISSVTLLRPKPLRVPRFVLDVHLGRLATYLRLVGLDALYRNDYDDAALAHLSGAEHRILLTRDRGLLMRNEITHGYCIRSSNPRQQLLEVIARFDLKRSLTPFSRCLRCNTLLQAVRPEDVGERVPPRVRGVQREYVVCPSCERVYWKGSHYEKMVRFLRAALAPEDAGHGSEALS